MEKMPFQPEGAAAQMRTVPATDVARHTAVAKVSELTTSDWRQGLPLLGSRRVTLRELKREDAPTLFSMLSTEEVARFISPPPTTVEGFERFIAWAIQERECGNYACFGVVPEGMTAPVGLFQVRSLEFGFGLAEWGFALGSAFWGTEIFAESADLVLGFAFDTIGVHRLEARASVANGRGNGALRKIGAVQEGVLRRSFLRNGEYHDQLLWSILAEDWQAGREELPRRIH
jgi:[ribosomal protein S5]-alanine N-acetyltransferase